MSRGETEGVVVAVVILAGFLGFTHIPDAILTYYIASKGLNQKSPPDETRVPAVETEEEPKNFG